MTTNSPITRQWILLQRVCARRYGATVKELAAEMEVSLKTIRRDLDMLQAAGFPLEETVLSHGLKRWRIDPERWQPSLGFAFDEDNRLHTSCYQGQYKAPTQSTRTKGWRSWHFCSDDDGWTWKPVSIIGPRHNETDIFPLGGNSWLAAARIDRMELIRSVDNGQTWQEATLRPVMRRSCQR